METLKSVFVALSAVLLVMDAVGAEPSSGPPRAVFADSEHARTVTITSAVRSNARLVWRLTSAERTLATGESAITTQPSGHAAATYTLRFPKADVPWETELVESVSDRELTRHAVWILPDDPFAERQTWLKTLELHVLDPAGTTTERWGIPA